MVKRFLGIFKRDKSGFSNEELEWQMKWVRIISHAYPIVIFLPWLVTFYLVARYSKNIDNDDIEFSIAIADIALYIILTILGDYFVFSRNFYNARDQLNENLKRQKKEKVWAYITEKNFHKLICRNPDLRQKSFQQALEYDMMAIIPLDYHEGVEISMSGDEDNLPILVKYDELLDYFYLYEDEDE